MITQIGWDILNSNNKGFLDDQSPSKNLQRKVKTLSFRASFAFLKLGDLTWIEVIRLLIFIFWITKIGRQYKTKPATSLRSSASLWPSCTSHGYISGIGSSAGRRTIGSSQDACAPAVRGLEWRPDDRSERVLDQFERQAVINKQKKRILVWVLVG